MNLQTGMTCHHHAAALGPASTATQQSLLVPRLQHIRATSCAHSRFQSGLWPSQSQVRPPPRRQHRITSAAGDTAGPGSSSSNDKQMGFIQRWQRDSKQMQAQLQALGAAGVIAYGLFNTLYYTVAFVFVWFSIANVPSGLGLSAAARKAAEVFALVWAGSQVTKFARAGAALACAPLIDKSLDKLGLQDKRKAYLLIVLACVLLATAVMGLVIALHA